MSAATYKLKESEKIVSHHYYYEDEILGDHEDDAVDQAIHECDMEQLKHALSNPDESEEDLAAVIHTQVLGHEMVDSLRGLIDAMPGKNRKHLVLAMTNVVVPLLDALAKEKEERHKEEFESTARHGFLNYEQAALHKIAQAFGGKNKHRPNIASMQHAYAQLSDAVNTIRSELNKHVRNAAQPKGKRRGSSGSLRNNAFETRLQKGKFASTITPSAHEKARDAATMMRHGAYPIGNHKRPRKGGGRNHG